MSRIQRRGGSPKQEAGIHTICCDESGFTGNNLLDAQQPHFAYAAVALEPHHAEPLIELIERRMGLTINEVKATTMYGSVKGRALLVEIAARVSSRSLLFMADKKFALACKFFEYVFEPVLAQNNGFFYRRGFHKFIANLLYIHLVVREVTAERMVTAFQKFMRSRNSDEIALLLGVSLNDEEHPLRKMLDFATSYHSQIGDELNTLGGNDAIGKWILDLTTTAVFNLLGAWGERFEQLDVYCDESKPLQSDPDLFNAMIGRTERSYMTFEDRAAPVTFNLAGPIKFVNSKSHTGVQVADLIAGAATFSMRENDADAAHFKEQIGELITVFPLGPQPKYIDLGAKAPFLNALLLDQLHERAIAGRDPFDGLLEEQMFSEWLYEVRPPSILETD